MDLLFFVIAVVLIIVLWPVIKAFALLILVAVVLWVLFNNTGRRL